MMQEFLSFIQYHWILAVLLLVLLLAVVLVEKLSAEAGGAMVSPQEAVQLINRNNAIVIDIRNRDAFVRGHIINALHLPLAELEKDIKKIQKNKQQPIIVVCAQGVDSTKAAKLIVDKEFEQVKILKGGLAAWRGEKLPVEKN